MDLDIGVGCTCRRGVGPKVSIHIQDTRWLNGERHEGRNNGSET